MRTWFRSRRTRWSVAVVAGLAVAIVLAAGCSSIGYYAQSVNGHFSVMRAARPVPDVIADPATEPVLRQRLERARQMREFASNELALPKNASYTEYADLKRPFVVWNVFATPELSLQLKQWCYPVVGCAGYRGYFDRSAADALARELRDDRYDVSVSGVQAYSTLGWFSDPLLNTFIGGAEGQVAGLVFHELAHQVVYVSGDTTFNESFATAVEREGVRRWLAANGDDATRDAYDQFVARRAAFLELLLKYRRLLELNYNSKASDAIKRERKVELLASLKSDYAQLKEGWGGFSGYDRYFAQDLSNAQLAAIGTYNDLVPGFDALLAQSGGDMPVFFQAVRRLASLPQAERTKELHDLAQRSAKQPGKGL